MILQISLALICIFSQVARNGALRPEDDTTLFTAGEIEERMGRQYEQDLDAGSRLADWAVAAVGAPCDMILEGRDVAGDRQRASTGSCTGQPQFEELLALTVADCPAKVSEALQRIRTSGAQSRCAAARDLLADWISDQHWLLQDLTQELAGATAWIPLHKLVQRDPSLGDDNTDAGRGPRKFLGTFVPRVYLYRVLDELRTGDIAIAVTGDDLIQDVAELGVLSLADDGNLVFVHCREGAFFVEESFRGFTVERKDVLGYKFLRLRDPVVDASRAPTISWNSGDFNGEPN